MKHTLTLLFALISLSVSSQPLGNYVDGLLKFHFTVDIDKKSDSEYTIDINAMSYDDVKVDGGWRITNETIDSFRMALDKSRELYAKWAKISVDNYQYDGRQDMTVTCPVVGFWKNEFREEFRDTVGLKFFYSVTLGNPNMYLNTGVLKSKGKQVKCFAIIFNSVAGYDKFIAIFDKSNIDNYKKTPSIYTE